MYFPFDTVIIIHRSHLYLTPKVTLRGTVKKVRGHSYLRSHLLNDFKSHFIFRKSCFYFPNKANIRKISAVVPEITELEHTWGSLSGPRDF